jgi:hypothetical protein
MWMQWNQQREYIINSWNVGWFIGTLFVIVNLCGQLIPCGMILARKKTDIACAILFFIIALQVNFKNVEIPVIYFSFVVTCISNYMGTSIFASVIYFFKQLLNKFSIGL